MDKIKTIVRRMKRKIFVFFGSLFRKKRRRHSFSRRYEGHPVEKNSYTSGAQRKGRTGAQKRADADDAILIFNRPVSKKKLLIVAVITAMVIIGVILALIFIPAQSSEEHSKAEPSSSVEPSATPAPTAKRTTAPTSSPTPTPEPTLAPGVTTDKVIELQTRLMELSYMEYDEPTDYYGPQTKAAVKMFQKKNDLTVDGFAGEETLALLFSDEAKSYMASLEDEGTDIQELQERLKELGYTDAATGYFGTETEAAVKEFQTRNQLTVDGKVGTETKEKLYSEDVIPFSYSVGEKGDDIKKFQNRLKELGYLTTTPDGTYGKDTLAAVKRFQEANGLIADGYIGPQTKELLLSKKAQANALSLGASGDDVTNIQKRLIKLGYLKGSATGYFGSDTENAVKSFQKKNGISVDGRVGSVTMNLLTSSKAKTSSGGTAGSGSGASKLISIANSKLGCKYVLGAKGPSKFDCSGFVYWCLNQAGVRQSYMTSYAWRTTSRYKRLKSMNGLNKGDILVFKMGATQGHVGIYIGGGMMIDASSRNGKVVKRSCTTAYWKSVFYCAYRIF